MPAEPGLPGPRKSSGIVNNHKTSKHISNDNDDRDNMSSMYYHL